LNELIEGRCESIYAQRLADFIRKEGHRWLDWIV
jgi:hypothetical protein